MTRIDAKGVYFKQLNEQIKLTSGDVTIDNCEGQRYIAAGLSGKSIEINGVPGNALAAYMNGASVKVNGNGQDAVGDTMNDGLVVINGSAGDALGYAMRGGKIYVRGSSGYRTGIHMKQYKEKAPVIIVGGATGSFLGEYQAGGLIIALNLQNEPRVVGNLTGTGIHGGKILLRTNALPNDLPKQVAASEANEDDMAEAAPYLREFAEIFGLNYDDIRSAKFMALKPNSANPYKQLYTTHF